jgi:hypothetical protein
MLAVLTTILSVQAQTLSELIRRDPQLSLVAGQESQFPQWANPNSQGTLIVARDDAVRRTDLQPSQAIFYANRTIRWSQVHYVIVEGVRPDMKIVFDNYAPGDGESKFEVHLRGYGLVNTQLSEQRTATNGMLYIAPEPLRPVVRPSINIPLLSTRFGELISEVGMWPFLDRLEGITIMVPNDDAMERQPLRNYTRQQKEAIILNHVIPRVIYTVSIVPSIPSVLGRPVTMRFGGERISVNGFANITIADHMMVSGVGQLIDGVLIPTELNNEQVRVTVQGHSWPIVGSTNTTTGSSSFGIMALPSTWMGVLSVLLLL